jgi:hypothetical protein
MTWLARRPVRGTAPGRETVADHALCGRRSRTAAARCRRCEMDELAAQSTPGDEGGAAICGSVATVCAACDGWAVVMYLSAKDEACEIMMPDWMPGSRRVWLHDGSPARDVPGRDVVGRASEPAPLTGKPVLSRTVGLVDVPALRAFPRGVPRVHEHYGYSGEFRLVGDERPELPECPGVRAPILRDRAYARDLG